MQRVGVLLLLGAMGWAVISPPAHAVGEPAGKIIMALGDVNVVRGNQTLKGSRGVEVLAGDSVTTGAASNAQMRLNDGAVIALRPNTDFKVEEFSFSGRADGSEKATVSLVKGGVRAVTGVIGRGNRDNLKVNAVVATVGIRGTGFNIVFCDAACRAAAPSAREGLYAGVFEGKIAVANSAGSSADLGVNRFAYVADATTSPEQLIAPPPFLKDSLESQSRVQQRQLALNGALQSNAATLEASGTVVNEPTDSGSEVGAVGAEKVNNVQVRTVQPDLVLAVPKQFFDAPFVGDLRDITPDAGNRTFALQSAEFNPAGSDRLANNQVITGVNFTTAVRPTRLAGSSFQVGEIAYDVLGGSGKSGGVTGYYSIVNAYSPGGRVSPIASPAQLKEGGTDGGVIAWGRWANGQAFVQRYGLINLEAAQGFHWIAGERITFVEGREITNANSTWNFKLFAATTPTEVRANAQLGWRVTGGGFTAVLASRSVVISNGLLNLYFARSDIGAGNFNFSFSGTSSSITSTQIAGVVTRVDGTAALCVTTCAATGAMGFYGDSKAGNITHAGLTYEFNSGALGYVQGAAIFKPTGTGN